MGLFDKLFGRWKGRKEFEGYFRMLNGYTPVFSTYDGGVYEMELTRACIHTFATHCSKLKPNVTGSSGRRFQQILEHHPNDLMSCSQFLYKAATIYDAQNTVFILPLLDQLDRIVGYYPADPSMGGDRTGGRRAVSGATPSALESGWRLNWPVAGSSASTCTTVTFSERATLF